MQLFSRPKSKPQPVKSGIEAALETKTVIEIILFWSLVENVEL